MKRPHLDLVNINWDLNSAWSWPAPIRVVVIIFSALLLAIICFNYDTQHELNELQILKQNEMQLKTVFEIKQKQTGDLIDQQAKSNVIESQWLDMAVKMPKEESASTLLHTISQMGIGSVGVRAARVCVQSGIGSQNQDSVRKDNQSPSSPTTCQPSRNST